ncbi:MAG: dephospho-CoA kinase [Lachnospiraceae bacterium]|nr:dephospho-CoA kinase [Lachnospiraceae bacterium]
MRIIGLTGGTGSGKSVVSQILSKKGAYVIDTDAIGHDIILKGKPAYNELVNYFGNEILDNNGEIARKKLGAIVFKEGKEKLAFLNSCTHKYIFMEIKNRIKLAQNENIEIVIIDAPLLLEGDFKNLCNEIWVVYAKEEVRLERIMARDKIDQEHGKNRIASQPTWEEYKRYANVIIDNSGKIEDVERQIEELFVKD